MGGGGEEWGLVLLHLYSVSQQHQNGRIVLIIDARVVSLNSGLGCERRAKNVSLGLYR